MVDVVFLGNSPRAFESLEWVLKSEGRTTCGDSVLAPSPPRASLYVVDADALTDEQVKQRQQWFGGAIFVVGNGSGPWRSCQEAVLQGIRDRLPTR